MTSLDRPRPRPHSSRVVAPPDGEANYHVFYALTSGASPAEVSAHGLLPEDKYPMVTEGNGRKPKAEHKQAWERITDAFQAVGFDTAALPHLTQALLDAGHPPERVVRILGGNLLRVLRTTLP